jgi:hypothetical protein
VLSLELVHPTGDILWLFEVNENQQILQIKMHRGIMQDQVASYPKDTGFYNTFL